MLVVAAMLVSGAADVQGKIDLGKREYDSNCASCHGMGGKGAGVQVDFLERTPPDGRTMSRRDGGVFPVGSACAVIEAAGTSHGTRDMPIWGQDDRGRAAEY